MELICKNPDKSEAPKFSKDKLKNSLKLIQCGGKAKMTVKTQNEGACQIICRHPLFGVMIFLENMNV